MELAFFSADGWECRDVSSVPVIPERMSVLVDDDLLFEDGAGLRPAAVASRWLRLRPTEGCPAPRSWEYYARILRDWILLADEHGVDVFGDRDRLKPLLSTYAVDRSCGRPGRRLEATTWNQHVGVPSSFYRWPRGTRTAITELVLVHLPANASEVWSGGGLGLTTEVVIESAILGLRELRLQRGPVQLRVGRRPAGVRDVQRTVLWATMMSAVWPTSSADGYGQIASDGFGPAALVEIVYALNEGEEHHQAQWSLENQLDYWQRTIAFFDAHLEDAT